MGDQLSQTFAALADPTRRAMLARLAEGRANVSELAEPFLDRMSLPAVTKHVQVLERAGLVVKTREAQRRPCELNPEAFERIDAWMAIYRAQMEESLDRLDAYLKSKQGSKNKRGPKSVEAPSSMPKPAKKKKKTQPKREQDGRKK
ncbi:Transcriptional repressor SdpR [Pseudobythopirellula maris]|uniref:Transcriptional repressor SdpR n=1 Tax=Pseudobythopirellula maris TaxID=2527991 RepID=A0A5C5ZMX8_9BACT|nr:metalloregulator ArsR/SmtB family transcription factor [Pseudobythopirellula maris]TWT88337.1 Transcriptional repressor SdpR [Pseudobythopirellula maris]